MSTRISALTKTHDNLQQVQGLSIDLTHLLHEMEMEVNEFPACAMIEKPKLSILSTCLGLRLFQKRGPISSDLKMVDCEFITTMNDDYELDFLHELKLTTDDECFYIAGRDKIWKIKSDGDHLNDLDVVPPGVVGIESHPLSLVCDGEWIASSHHQTTKVRPDDADADEDDAFQIKERGLITLMRCDHFDSTLQIRLDHADHSNPILLSPLCFMGGPPTQRHMFLLKQYSFWNETEQELSHGIRIANFDETQAEEMHEVKTNLMRKDIVQSEARDSEQCATMFPTHFRDFQRLHRSSPFFYPSFGQHSPWWDGKNDVKMIVADDSTHPENQQFRNSLVHIHTARIPWDAAKAAHAARESPDNVSDWEVCALLKDGGDHSSLQIRSKIHVRPPPLLLCECSLSEYELNDVPVALCGTSFDDQFCLSSMSENVFLFERIVWGVKSKSAAQFAFLKPKGGSKRRSKSRKYKSRKYKSRKYKSRKLKKH